MHNPWTQAIAWGWPGVGWTLGGGGKSGENETDLRYCQ